ncbi:hypothetical protein EZV62_009621 [Acer yangbiense]|uniref:Uncharacterized protein n=1 Tax=Acer yangbiense TaxID=1000413 RepID=A0A5C7HZQ4_9ROSI|nr:hypothetical protein EZV62_009621 [Acer yangbiense]
MILEGGLAHLRDAVSGCDSRNQECFGKEGMAYRPGMAMCLCNRNFKDKAWRGKQSSIDEHECLEWLSSKKPDSVVYICFGTLAEFSSAQLMEIALGIEASGQEFIWVVRKNKKDEDGNED